jgi:UDP-N-acetylglucosamine--N-acetylmuramyl-(pentapeptide) pyrophosphoryl-undecaprenol N-acetylglucosamine transferase
MSASARHYIIACGGTGGHLAPGIALAEGLVARGHTVQLLVSRKTIDSRILEKYKGLDAVAVPAAPFSLSPAGFCRFAWQQASGLWFCIGLVRRTRPDAIIGFGGFTTMGIMLAGLLLRVPLIMHEANRVPGRATREFGPFARRVWVPQGVDLPMVRPARVRECGLPVRAEFRRKQKSAAMAELGFVPATRTLVVLGGSQGASALNDWAAGAVKPLAAAGAQIICVTGPGKTNDRIVTVLSANNGSTIHSYRMPFCDRMAELLSCADLVVTRAGAGTIAELARIGVPSVLVPFPQAADDHQIANARFVEQQGGGFVVEQPFIAGLTKEVLEVIFNEGLLARLRSNLARIARADPLELMIEDIEQIGNGASAKKSTALQLA